MLRISTMNKILVLTGLCFIALLLYPFSGNREHRISCKADISYQWQDSTLNLFISQNIQNGKGILALSGTLHEKNKGDGYLSKTISFSYREQGYYYHLNSDLVINSPQMTMSVQDQRKWLPDFFIEKGKPLLLKIRPYGDKAWLFYSETTPLFVCERSS